MKSLLVIGGTGFFGKSILDAFQRGLLSKFKIHRIIIAARSVDKFPFIYPELISENIEFFQFDVAVSAKIPKADIIIYAASPTNPDFYEGNEGIQIEKNGLAIFNFCKLVKNQKINSKILFCSSGAVYGKQPSNVDFMDEEFPFQDLSELAQYKRNYALSKRMTEKEIINLGHQGLDVSIARCFAFYGDYLPRNQHFAYGNFLGNAERGETIEVKANHQVVRSYMHANDLVNALLYIALDANPSCPVYNVGSDDAVEIRELAKTIAEEYNVKFKLASITKSEVDRYVPNVSKIKCKYFGGR